MLARWGSIVYCSRKLVLALSALGLLLSIGVLATVKPDLSSSGFVSEEAESTRVERRLADEFGRGRSSLVVIFDAGRPVGEPAVRAEVEAALAPVAADPRVARVLTTWSTGNPSFVSHDGESTYAVALLTLTDDEAQEALGELRGLVETGAAPSGLVVSVTGGATIGEEIAHEVEEGIVRGETISIPLTIVIQVVIFGGLIAAGVPLLVGLFAIAGSMALLFALSTGSFQSVFATNIIVTLGLALGIDYSLFMVARFREELARHPVPEALAITTATVGKAMLFSGVTVIFGLAATRFFPLPALRSMGLGGMIVVALALVYGLTFLPALLAVLGTRVNALSLRRRGGEAAIRPDGGGFWHGVATAVMRRPVAVLLPTLLILVLAGLPFRRLDLTPGGPEQLPAGNPARTTFERLQRDFPAGEADPVPAIVTIEGAEVRSAAGIAALGAFVDAAAAVPRVTRVESILTDPAAAGVDWLADPATLPGPARALLGERVRGDATFVEVVADVEGAELERVVRALRDLDLPGARVEYGGVAATSVDTVEGIKAGIAPALIFVIVGSYLILLLTFGSVLLPLKAILLTLLSISASLGTLVLVFQDGRFERLLGFEASGEIISTTPILMFCVLFGLSMDYEVLMLTRIQEEWRRTGDNTAAVALGLERTAKVITGAAAIMVVVFAGFMLADVVIIKSLGFGWALAVLIDATIVRALLVPATMRLLGRWNWWAPAPVRTVVERLGFGHAEPARATAAAAD